MATIRPKALPAATTVQAGDTFLIDGATGVRALAATSVLIPDANSNIARSDPATGYTGFANGLQINQGALFPTTQQYLGGSVVVRQALIGASVIPSTDTTTWQAAGVAGYAHGNVAGTGRNLVGVYGQATTSVANGNLFGGNTLATNADGSTSNIGFDANYITAFEFNVNLWKKAGGSDPVVTGGHVYGITIAGSGNIAGQIVGSAGIVINQMSVGSGIAWNYGMQTYDGAATIGVQLGTNGTGNNVNGQSLRSTGRDAGGVAHTIDVHGDPNGALILAPDSLSTVVALLSGIGGSTVFQTGNVFGNAKINVPALTTAGVITNDGSGNFVSVTSLGLTGSIKSSGTAGIGYATGAGGAVTQATSKSTGVTLNKTCGQITMNAAALASGASASFTLTNSAIAATDVVMPSIASGATAGAYRIFCDATAAGSCQISLTNGSGGSLSEAIVINFVVLKGVNA